MLLNSFRRHHLMTELMGHLATKLRKFGGFIFASTVILTACDSPPAVYDCFDTPLISVHCDFSKPEDIELLPDGSLIISEMTQDPNVAEGEGNISHYDPSTGDKYVIPIRLGAKATNWGQQNCSAPDQLAPHGIHLSPHYEGESWLLLVVNHRHAQLADDTWSDAVEFFELSTTLGSFQMVWRGCVELDSAFINDVTSTLDGGVLMTKMFDKSDSGISLIWDLFTGADTGELLYFSKELGVTSVPNSRGVLPNGVAVTPGQATVAHVAFYGDDSVVSLDYQTGERLNQVRVDSPDNLVYARGKLWVSGHFFSFSEAQTCLEQSKACQLPFGIYELTLPNLNLTEVLFVDGPPIGAVSVSVPVFDQSAEPSGFWLGSFVGDRIGYFEVKKSLQ